MNEDTTTPQPATDGLGRWLVGGVVVGAAILGLLIGAYAIGYHRGQDHTRTQASTPATTPPATTPATPGKTTTALGAVTVTPALVSRGKTLFAADGCTACHSLAGKTGVGPPLNAIAGNKVTLATGQTITVDDAYLEQSIADPDAKIVKGYRDGVMSAAIASYNLNSKPDDIRALVALIKSQK
ncbi:MAG: c-type cytochrome [Gaiellales bacterium]